MLCDMDLEQALRVRLIRRQLASGEARLLREKTGTSATTFASTIGVHPITLYRWEQAKAVPQPGSALRYAIALDALSEAS